jgi:ElaB/YqjD/DUF883 family membrane-anchored ribosome-binding protein
MVDDKTVDLSATQLESARPDGPISARSALNETARKVKDTLSSVFDSIRESSPRDTMRKTGEAADQVKQRTAEAAGQVRHYLEERSLPEMVDDMTALIRRYPIQSLLVGAAFGMLLGRKRGRRYNES